MISAGDFRNGVTFEEDGNVLQVIELKRVTTQQLSSLPLTSKEKK